MSTTEATLPQALRSQSKQARGFTVTREAVNVEARTATLAFASEAPVERGWGWEILDCTRNAVRLGRLQTGANLLCDHDWRDVVGVVESVEMGADRVIRAAVRFGKSARASEVWQDVVDGIRRNVSVGYLIHEAQLDGKRDGLDAFRVTDWEPYELSLVSVPADASVGVGRSAPGSETTAAQARSVVVSTTVTTTTWADDMESEDEAGEGAEDMATDPATSETAQQSQPAQRGQKETKVTIEAPVQRNHAAEISAIATTIPGGAEMALDAIQRGITVEQFQGEALKRMSNKPLPTADIGLSDKQIRSYSLMRAINALARPGDADAQRAAAFERECSAGVASKLGKASRGLFIPFEIQKRDLVAGTPTAGGNLVATDLLAGSFIDILRNAMVLDQLGAQMLTGLVGNVAIPKLTGSATAFWVAENLAPTETQQTVGQVTMTPKTVGAYVDIGRNLMLQSSLDIESMVAGDLAAILGQAIQQAAISGTGTANQPSGILTQVTPTVIGGANGAAPTWQNMIDLETGVATANADVGALAYLTNAKVRGKLKSTPKVTGFPQYIWDTNSSDTPINGYRSVVTNAVPSNLTKGTSAGVASAIIFGNFRDLVIGMWGGLDLMVDPYTGSAAGTVRVRALQEVDVALRNVVSFATMADALTV